MALAGDLGTFELVDLLEWVVRRSKSGRLTLRRLSTEKRLGFRDGQLNSSTSNDPRETLGQVLVRDQLLGEEELFRALLRQEQEHRLLGEILVKDGALTPEQLRHALESKTEETLYDLFLWTDGRFEFEEGEPPPAPAGIEMDLLTIVQEGLHRRKQWRELQGRLPATATFKVLRAGLGNADPVEQKMLGLAAAGRTLAGISLETRRSEFETTLRLDALVQSGALQVSGSESEGAPLDPVGAIQALLSRAEQLLHEHSYDGALRCYEAVLVVDRLNQAAKKGLLAVAEARRQWKILNRMPLDGVPVVRMASMALTRQRFEPEEGFVLSRINAQWSLRAILKLCPMPEADTLAIFARLVERGVVELQETPAPRK